MNAHPESLVGATVRAGINSERFFETMKHLFSSATAFVGELMQNSRRANASQVAFNMNAETNTLTITDDGDGIADFQDLLQLCESNWSEETMLTERPFGMGVFSLFHAASEVMFQSKGRRLLVTLDDVVQGRFLAVTACSEAPAKGTVVTMRGVDPTILCEYPAVTFSTGYCRTKLEQAVVQMAQGFPIQVRLNNVEIARPHAQEELPGQHTQLGFVSIAGLHRAGTQIDVTSPTLYLQGLPIMGTGSNKNACIVHLDSTRFVARMPDRTELYDGVAARRRIIDSLKELAREGLARLKQEMPAREFVVRHWDNAMQLDAISLMNDIPLLPRAVLPSIAGAYAIRSDVLEYQDDAAEDLVARADVLSGRVRVWRNAPLSTLDSPQAAQVLKTMERAGIKALTASLDSGHWLVACTDSVDDLRFECKAAGTFATADLTVEGVDCRVEMVESVTIEVTSNTNQALDLSLELDNDWVLVPVEGDKSKVESQWWNGHDKFTCYVTKRHHERGHPVEALNEFSVDDEFDEDWCNSAIDAWDARVEALRGRTLATVLQRALLDVSGRPSEPNSSHLAVVHARIVRNGPRHAGHYDFAVVDLEVEQFWADLAARIEARGRQDLPMASRLRKAFAEVVKQGPAV